MAEAIKQGKHPNSKKGQFQKGHAPIGFQIPGHKHREATKRKIGSKLEGDKTKLWRGGISARYKAKNAPRPKPDRCEACGVLGSDTRVGLCYDHDHATGNFRGWLCNRCNLVLGLVKDNEGLLENLKQYLAKVYGNTQPRTIGESDNNS